MQSTNAKVLAVVCLLAASFRNHAENRPISTPLRTPSPMNLAIAFNCAGDLREPRAWYVGPYKGYDNNLSPLDLARDFYCADQFKSRFFPKGFVTVYGSSNLKENTPDKDPFPAGDGTLSAEDIQDYKSSYAQVMEFSTLWTKDYGQDYPISTGAGPGLMEAAARGATEAGGVSVGYTTYYGPPAAGSGDGQSDVPSFAKYEHAGSKHDITSTGLIFSSVSARETSMILHSAAIVIAPGGSGTEWEIFQILEMLKSYQLRPVPIYFIGASFHWDSLQARLRSMRQRGTLKPDQLAKLTFVACPQELVERLVTDLKIPHKGETFAGCKPPSDYQKKIMMEL